MGALEQLRNGEFTDRVRSNPRLAVAIAGGAVLLLAWIAWAIYVTGSQGATAGLGVVIAWPALLAALALVSLPFIGGYLLIRRLSSDQSAVATSAADADQSEDEEESEDDEEAEDDDEESEDEADEEESEAETAAG